VKRQVVKLNFGSLAHSKKICNKKIEEVGSICTCFSRRSPQILSGCILAEKTGPMEAAITWDWFANTDLHDRCK